MGLEKSLPILDEVRRKMNLPVVTDVHTAEQCAEVAQVVDAADPCLPVPPDRSSRRAAQTGKIVNVKKGQFLAPGT